MADSLYNALLGEDLTVITVQPLSVDNATGDLSDLGSSIDLVGMIMEVDPTEESINQDMRPVNEPGINMVPVSHGTFLRLAVIQDKGVTQLTKRTQLSETPSRRFRISTVMGGEQEDTYATFRRRNRGIKDRGMNLAVFEFDPMKPRNASQVTYTANE